MAFVSDPEAVQLHSNCLHGNRTGLVTSFIQQQVPTAYLVSDAGHELHYILPFHELHNGNFPKLFQALDSSFPALQIHSYGVADTTLEEIFLKVTEAACLEEDGNWLDVVYLSYRFVYSLLLLLSVTCNMLLLLLCSAYGERSSYILC